MTLSTPCTHTLTPFCWGHPGSAVLDLLFAPCDCDAMTMYVVWIGRYGRDNTPAAVVAAMSPVRQTLYR